MMNTELATVESSNSFGYKLAYRDFNGAVALCLIEELNGVSTILAVHRGTKFSAADVLPTTLVMQYLPSIIFELPEL